MPTARALCVGMERLFQAGQAGGVVFRHDFMNKKLFISIFLLGLWAVTDHSRGAQNLPLDQLVAVNEGLVRYNAGAEEDLHAAIGIFSGVLEQNPRETTALLFRALSYGALGLEQRKPRSDLQERIRDREVSLTVSD